MPSEYMDLIVIPQVLHIDPLQFAEYPLVLQQRIRGLLQAHIAHGWAGNTEMVDRGQ